MITATTHPTDTYTDDDGQPLTTAEWLSDRCYFLADLEAEIAPTQARITELRAEISELTAVLGRTTIPEFGTVEITSAAMVASYDRAGLDALVHALLADGQLELAQRIGGLRRETSRAGSLRITRQKPAPTTDA